MAFGCWPEVRMRSKPKSISCSKASKGSRQRSKARWKVRDIPCAFSTRRRLASMSIVPSSCKHPITTPSAPSWRATSMSASMRSSSTGVERKSPPRGRMMTCRRVVVSTRRATMISPYDGVVPPSGIPAHSSTRSAPPAWAARQLSTPLAQTSNRNKFLSMSLYCFSCKSTAISPFLQIKVVFLHPQSG